ncbi:MAG: hypothetical protein GY918_08400 [Gammaproteobacteria bacterium]|nr:hypothetical protein [Gammaproteobacteria bacterium]
MKYVHQFLVTRVSLIAIGAMLTVPLPAVAEEIHGDETNLGNVSLGIKTLNFVSTGVWNTAIGDSALYSNTTGNRNTASGDSALYSNTTGTRNTASGSFALHKNKTGWNNTASGFRALRNNTMGLFNTAIGVSALSANTTADNNTAIGVSALSNNTTADNNTAIGALALRRTAIGGHNTAIGYEAGGYNQRGNKNVFIGYQAGNNVDYSNKSGQLVIANGPLPVNQLLIGDFSKRTLLINGRTSINKDAMVRGNLKVQGKAFAASFEQSDGRLKKDIKPLSHALDSILQLQGKTYRWKEDTTFANKQDIGLIAQDVEKVFPEFVAEDEQGYKAVAYSKLTAVLIEAMKEQQGQMISQQQQIAVLEEENQQLKTIMAEQMQALLARVAMLEGTPLVAN